jgi:hypothetical protein
VREGERGVGAGRWPMRPGKIIALLD